MKKVLFLLSFTLLAACAHDQNRVVASDDQCVAGDTCSSNGYTGHYFQKRPLTY